MRSGWKANRFHPWQDYLPCLEQQMEAAETGVSTIHSVDAALQLVIQIESSDINEVFPAALAATDAAFVKKLRPFQKAMEAHLSYIVERFPELSPHMILAARNSGQGFLRYGDRGGQGQHNRGIRANGQQHQCVRQPQA